MVDVLEALKEIKEYENKKELEESKKNESGIFKLQVEEDISISEKDFKEYLSCQYSGLTNMFNFGNVEIITGLERKQIKAITKNYEFLLNKYGGLE